MSAVARDDIAMSNLSQVGNLTKPPDKTTAPSPSVPHTASTGVDPPHPVPVFKMLQIIFAWASAVVFVLDPFTDILALNGMLYITFLYIPCLIFILLPILVKLRRNIPYVKHMWTQNIPWYILVPMSTAVLLGFSLVFDIIYNARKMVEYRKRTGQPDEYMKRSFTDIIHDQINIAKKRLLELTTVSFPQLGLQVFAVLFTKIYPTVLCTAKLLWPTLECADVCLPGIYGCDGKVHCVDDGYSVTATGDLLLFGTVGNFSSPIDEDQCSFSLSIGGIMVSACISAISITWTVTSLYRLQYLKNSMERESYAEVPWLLTPLLIASVLISLLAKGLIFVLYYYIVVFHFLFKAKRQLGDYYIFDFLRELYYLISIYMVYILLLISLLVIVQCVLKRPAAPSMTVISTLQHIIYFSIVPSYNLIYPSPLPKWFHISHYCLELIRDMSMLFVTALLGGNGISIIELVLYLLLSIGGVLLYLLFRWRLSKRSQ